MNQDLTKLVENHRITLVSGKPDYRAIRKIEQEIHGEPITEYPGEWKNYSRDQHLEWHTRYMTFPNGHRVYDGCMWCEDACRDLEATKAGLAVKHAAEVKARRREARSRNVAVLIPRIAFVVGFTAIMIIFAVIA